MSSVSSVTTNGTLEYGPNGNMKVIFKNGTLQGMTFVHLHTHANNLFSPEFRNQTTALKVCHATLLRLSQKEHWEGIANETDTKHILLNIGMYAHQCKCQITDYRDGLLENLDVSFNRRWVLNALDELNPLSITSPGPQFELQLAGLLHLPRELRKVCFENKYLSGRTIKVVTPDEEGDEMGVGLVNIEICAPGIRIKTKVKQDSDEPFTTSKSFVFVDECLVELENNEPIQIANSKGVIKSLVKLLTPAEVDKSDSSSDES